MRDPDFKKYIERNGVRCPYCNADQLDGDNVEIGEGVATQDVRCLECDQEWTDVYRLTEVCSDDEFWRRSTTYEKDLYGARF